MTSELIRPEPLPLSALRTVWLAAAVQAVTTDDLAVQYETAQSPPLGAVTVGVVSELPLFVVDSLPDATTGVTPSVPE